MQKELKPTTIFFYTQVYFLDTAIEYVRLLTSQGYILHVGIELSPNQLKANILDIAANLNAYAALTPFHTVADIWELQYLSSYFEACTSVNFVVYPTKKIGGTRKVAKALANYIDTIQPDYIHLDDFSSRSLFYVPYFFRHRKKIIANIHDPLTHSGEFQLKRELYRKLWFKLIPSFVVFSTFSKSILAPQLHKRKKITVLKLMPYSVYQSFLPTTTTKIDTTKKYISFVGRISPYKGVDLFVGATELLSNKHPELQFYIGGKSSDEYHPDFLNIEHKNLTIENKFLSNAEMASIISRSQLIVCPYKDATQSGVIMTAYALGCPVLVTNTGGLPEYIIHNKTGLICQENSIEGLANAMDTFINNNLAVHLADAIVNTDYRDMFADSNKLTIKEIYEI